MAAEQPPVVFRTLWDTRNVTAGYGSSASNQIRLPFVNGGTYITAWNQADVLHTYTEGGEYEISITGKVKGWGFGSIGSNRKDGEKLLDVLEWGVLEFANDGFYFARCENLTGFSAEDAIPLDGITNLSGMFWGASSFNGDLSSWDVSNVTNMRGLFHNAHSFNGDISGWDVSNVTDMTNMFNYTNLSTANYSAILMGWNSLPSLQSRVQLSAYGVKYSAVAEYNAAAEAARNNLINTYGWYIYDSGKE